MIGSLSMDDLEHTSTATGNGKIWSVLKGTGVESLQRKLIETTIERKKALLERLVIVTLFLDSRNLSFRGNTNRLNEPDNGNFLGIVQLLAKYEPILHEHVLQNVTKSQQTRKNHATHYLTHDIQNQFIELCGQRVLYAI